MTAPSFALRHEDRPRPLDRLARRLPRVGLRGVLDDLDRTGRAADVPGEAAVEGFAWDDADDHDPRWYPQGVALPEPVDGRQVLLVSWYAKRARWGRTPGSRITVVDRSEPERPRYRHVLLVDTALRWPALGRGRLRMRRVPVHAGGIAVHGDLLLVADTFAGLRVFDLRDVVRVPRRRLDAWAPWRGAGTRTFGHRVTGGFTAHGYRYVLPQRSAYRVDGRLIGPRLRYSFLGIAGRDGDDPRLVVGEYGRKDQTHRLVEFALDPATGGPRLGDDGRCASLAVHEDQPARMQGVAVVDGHWYLTASAGEGNPGTLWVGEPGAFRARRGVLPTGPEDLDPSPDGTRLWTTCEWPSRRFTFALDPAAWR